MKNLLTENIDIWTTAQIQKNGVGRGNGSAKQNLHGIKKLRELILELAVRGKLVPQDPNDEPASVLLERIAKEKARLIKEGRFKKQEPLLEVTYDENPYELPDGWSRIRLGDIANLVYGKNLSTTKLIDTGFDVFGANGVIGKHSSYIYKDPQVLISCRGAYSGKANMSPEKCFITNNSIVCELTENTLNKIFLYLSLSAIDKNTIVTGSAQPQVTVANANPVVLAVPPLAEQHRIVAKVDELMAICDQLEQKQTDSNAAHQTLVVTLLSTLTSATNHAEFVEAWQRIASHFDILFTTEKSLDQLKQIILQLAVMGKLVPQDTNDEPSSVLLKKISAEKARLIKAGENKKEKPLPEISDDERPYELPQGWEWVRLYQIIQISSGDGLTAANMNKDGNIPVYGGNGVTGYHDRANITKPTLVIGRVGFYCGSIHKTPASAWVTDNAFITTFSENNLYIDFLYWLLKGTNLKENENATAQPVISGRKVYPIVAGLPPLAEQHRIVAKVDELMTICDKLKARLQEAQTTQIHLADAIVEQAVS